MPLYSIFECHLCLAGESKLRLDRLTLKMFVHSIRQKPHCEGFFRERLIFNGKASSKQHVNYKIRKLEGETYVMLDADEADGVIVDNEYNQDQDSGHLLSTVIARKLSASSTALHAKESRFALDLERDEVVLKSCAETEDSGNDGAINQPSL